MNGDCRIIMGEWVVTSFFFSLYLSSFLMKFLSYRLEKEKKKKGESDFWRELA